MSSPFDDRPNGTPRWPTFRGAFLAEDRVQRVSNLPHIIFFAQGKHLVRETASGGFTPTGTPKEYPVVSFEAQRWVRQLNDPRKIPLYAICWLGQYMNGSIFHMGWQYPHVLQFHPQAVEVAAFELYREVALALYGEEPMDYDVRKFITQGSDGIRVK